MPALPLEEVVLEAIRAKLAAVVAGVDYFYTCERAVRPVTAQVKHLSEVAEDKFIALIESSESIYTQSSPGEDCPTDIEATIIVTAAVPYRHTEVVHESSYDLTTIQQKLVRDLRKALDKQNLGGVYTIVTDRSLDVEVGGWAVVQVSVNWIGSESL